MELLLTAAVSLVGYQLINNNNNNNTINNKKVRMRLSDHEIASSKNVYHADYVNEMRLLEEKKVSFNVSQSRQRDPKIISRTYTLQRDDTRQQEYEESLNDRRIERLDVKPDEHALPTFAELNVPPPPPLKLTPHFKGNLKTPANHARRIEAFTTGTFTASKQEQTESLNPVIVRNPHDDALTFKKYYSPSLLENNVLPFDQQKVTPITEKSQALRPRGLDLVSLKAKDVFDPQADPKPVFELPLTTPRGYNSIQNNHVFVSQNKPPRSFENEHVFPGRASVSADTQHGQFRQKPTERGSMVLTQAPGKFFVQASYKKTESTAPRKTSFESSVQHAKNTVPRGTVFNKDAFVLAETERDNENDFRVNMSAKDKKPQPHVKLPLRRTQKQDTEQAAQINHFERPQENYFNNSTGALTNKKIPLASGIIESVKKTQQIPQQQVYLTRARI